MTPFDMAEISASKPSSNTQDIMQVDAADIRAHCVGYKDAVLFKSVFQLVTTLGLFVLNLAAMAWVLPISYGLSLLLAVPAAGLLTRIFIIQHDCGHRSFFKSKALNDWVGRFMGLLTFTPYDFWRRAHNMHHAVSGDLDRRSIGGIDTITVREYQALSPLKKLGYRLYRNPFLLVFVGTPIYTIFAQRMPFNKSFEFYEGYKTLPSSSIWQSIMLNNLALVVLWGGLSFIFGWSLVLAVYLPVLVGTAWIGGWLFYIQHQFEDAYWERHADWNVLEAALMGSSYYKMPKVLQWFTGNIGLHHIHHLCAQIPNYRLQECMDARPELAEINTITIWDSFKCAHLKIWDEEAKQMVTLSSLKA